MKETDENKERGSGCSDANCSPLITESDFNQINFGIWCSGIYIYQVPHPYDKKRFAQDSPVALIKSKRHNVEGFKEALILFNDHASSL